MTDRTIEESARSVYRDELVPSGIGPTTTDTAPPSGVMTRPRSWSRAAARVDVGNDWTAMLRVGSTHARVQVRVRNVSASGALLETLSPLWITSGEGISIKFAPAPWSRWLPIVMPGTVRRADLDHGATVHLAIHLDHDQGGDWIDWRDAMERLLGYETTHRHSAISVTGAGVVAEVFDHLTGAPLARGVLASVEPDRALLKEVVLRGPLDGARRLVDLFVAPPPRGAGGPRTAAIRRVFALLGHGFCLVDLPEGTASHVLLAGALDEVGALPETRLERRRFRRVSPPRPIAVRAFDPASRAEILRGSVQDLSLRSIGIATDAAPPEGALSSRDVQLELELDDEPFHERGATAAARTVVRASGRLHWDGAGRRWSAEILRFYSLQPQAARFRREVEDGLFEQTTTQAVPIADVWRALRHYLEQNGLHDLRNDIWPHFRETSRALREHPELGHIVLSNDNRMTMAFARLYERTWVGHQFAKARAAEGEEPRTPEDEAVEEERARIDRREVYRHAFELAQSAEGTEFVAGYYTRDIPWMLEQHGGFVHREGDDRTAVQVPIRLWRVRSRPLRAPPLTRGDVEVITQGSRDDRARLLAAMASRYPHLYREALDFTPERIDLRGIRGRFALAGLARERGIVYARVGGLTVAAGVTELAPPGLSIFGLFDSLRIIPLLEPDAIDEATWAEVTTGLLRAAAAWFARWAGDRARGEAAFLFIDEAPGSEEEAAEVDRGNHVLQPSNGVEFEVKSAGRGYLWIVRATRVPAFLDDVSHALDPAARIRSVP